MPLMKWQGGSEYRSSGVRKIGGSLQSGEDIQKGCFPGKTDGNGGECSESYGGTRKVQAFEKRVFRVFIVQFLFMREVDLGGFCDGRGYALLSGSLFCQKGIR